MSSLKSRKRTERITNALCFIALIFQIGRAHV